MTTLNEFLAKAYVEIVNPTISLLFGIAFLVFFWGTFSFIKGYGDETNRAEGQRHMLWGVIGIFIMVAVFGIMRLIANAFGLDESLIPN